MITVGTKVVDTKTGLKAEVKWTDGETALIALASGLRVKYPVRFLAAIA
jgi:hypothetical protein